jgi:hypothetical protein
LKSSYSGQGIVYEVGMQLTTLAPAAKSSPARQPQRRPSLLRVSLIVNAKIGAL